MGVSLEVVGAYLKDLLPDYTFDEKLLKEFYERNEELFCLTQSFDFNETSKVKNERGFLVSSDLQRYFGCWWSIILATLKEKPDMELTIITKETIREEFGWTTNDVGGMKKRKGINLFRHSGELYTEGFGKMEGVVFLFKYDEDFYIMSPDGKEMRVWQGE